MFGSDYFNNIIGGNLSDASQIYSAVSERNRLAQAKNTREIVSALKNLEKTLKEMSLELQKKVMDAKKRLIFIEAKSYDYTNENRRSK